MITEVKKYQITCKKCDHTWTPRKVEIRQCPKCHSPWFDKEKEVKK
jgi:Zn finger protein HypA/HybF involved in hydrogenase expression